MNNVPRLDLAPKLKRPLSLKNPFDYLLLLYWVFFFPQAIKYYVEKYIDISEIKELKTFKEKSQYLFTHTVLRELILQSIILIILPICFSKTPIINSQFIVNQTIDIYSKNFIFNLDNVLIIFQNIVNNLVLILKNLIQNGNLLQIFIGIFFCLAGFYNKKSSLSSLALGIAIGILFSISSGIELILMVSEHKFMLFYTFILFSNCALVILYDETKINELGIFNPLLGFSVSFSIGTISIFATAPLLISQYGFLLGIALSFLVTILVILFLTPIGIIWLIIHARLDNWLLLLPFNIFSKNKFNFLPRVTLIPVPGLYSQIVRELKYDWEKGLNNIDELLKYTIQIVPVTFAIHNVLNKTPQEKLFSNINQLVNKINNLELMYIYTEPLRLLIKHLLVFSLMFFPVLVLVLPLAILHNVLSIFFSSNLVDNILNNTIKFFQKNTVQNNKNNIDSKKNRPNYNTQHFIASGFWYLYKKEPEKSKEAFSSVQHLPHGQELFILADIFSNLINNDFFNSLNYISSVEIPKDELIRERTWQVIRKLQIISEDSLLVENSQSRQNRSLANNRAIGELEKILENPNSLPELERAMIIDIAQGWQKKLAQNASEIGDNSILETVPNPYVIGDPVIGQLFVGREDIIRQLKEIWLAKNQIQSVILYGHRRMGKTSILMNISDKLGSKVKLAYINLNGLGDIAGVDEVFMAITDAISEKLNIAPPDDQDLSQSPYPTFRRYLKQITQNNLTEYSLIIALDEFETLENLIEAQKISSEFLGFLRSMMQLSPKIAFAFAGLHTLDEMTADYFQPFFASIIPIRVNFLSEGATHQLLANPNDEFPLDYQPEALDLIYQLTAGQPYLVQLIGFFLVRRYNDQVFEMGKPRDPILTTEDVNAIINHSEFFKNGRYYFTGVWGQASQNAPAQQEILRAIAPYPQGLDILSIETITGIDQTTLEIALKTLERHDVIQEKTGKWSIIVELFRRWVEQEKTSNS